MPAPLCLTSHQNIRVGSAKIGLNPVTSVRSTGDAPWIRISKKGPAVPELWLSADEIATHLGVSKDTVYAWIADRDMPAHKIGRLWKFQASEVDDWVRRGGASAPGGSD